MSETFSLSGLRVLERNYLDVYPYDTWKSIELPSLMPGTELPILSLTVDAGETTRPNVLSEAELITAMDKNGIGTVFRLSSHLRFEKKKTII
jgi:DNA topoisomerase-3